MIDLQDATTAQIFQELVKRYDHMVMVGIPKSPSDQGLFLSGNKAKLDELMTECIAGRFTIAFAGATGAATDAPLKQPRMNALTPEEQAQPLMMALARTFGEMILCGIPNETPQLENPIVYVQPDPRYADQKQIKNLRRIKKQIDTTPV